jgi:hypothetical protein
MILHQENADDDDLVFIVDDEQVSNYSSPSQVYRVPEILLSATLQESSLERANFEEFNLESLCCSICFEVNTEPRILSCYHVFCRSCLLRLYLTGACDQQQPLIRYIKCPLCRRLVRLRDVRAFSVITDLLSELLENELHRAADRISLAYVDQTTPSPVNERDVDQQNHTN